MLRSRSSSYDRSSDSDLAHRRHRHRKHKSKRSHRSSHSRSPSSSRRRHRGRHHSRSRSRSHSSSRSRRHSRSRRRSRSSSPSSYRSSRDSSLAHENWTTGSAEQNKLRTKAALQAAAADDTSLHDAPASDVKDRLTFQEQIRQVSAMDEIESAEFVPAPFRSSRSEKSTSETASSSHDSVMLGLPLTSTSAKPLDLSKFDNASLPHPNLFVPYEEKIGRWIEFLKSYKKKMATSENEGSR